MCLCCKHNNKETENVCEFAGMTSHHIPYCLTCIDHQNRNLHKQNQKNIQNHNTSLNHIQDLYQSKLNHQKKNQMRNICHNKTRHKKNSTNLVPNQIYNKFCSYKYHTRKIRKLCNTRTLPSSLEKKVSQLR